MTLGSVPGHVLAGSVTGQGRVLDLSPEGAGWVFSSLGVVELGPGESHRFTTGVAEMLVVPLSGACRVACDDVRLELAGRTGVFAGVTDFAYLPIDSVVTIDSERGGRFALPGARAERRLEFRYGPAAGVSVELRGAGSCSRQVNNVCTPETFAADRLISVEVLTPGGNWSSYPPHKHDEHGIDETQLEEIYYFEVAPGPAGPGFGYQRVYGREGRPIDILAEVRSGDAVLIPHGWHGPSMAAPGYDLYYLNVMAGPERAWQICDDPAHSWVRQLWVGQPVDPRLPFGERSASGNSSMQ